MINTPSPFGEAWRSSQQKLCLFACVSKFLLTFAAAMVHCTSDQKGIG